MLELNQILIVTSEFPPLPGGIGNHAYNIALQLENNGYKVEVISDQRDIEKNTEDEFDGQLRFKVHRVPFRNRRLIMYIKRVQLLFKHVKEKDIVIASGKFSLWIVAFVSLFYQKKYVAVLHGSEVNLTNKIFKYLIDISLKRFKNLIAVSNYTKALLHKSLRAHCVVIPNGINLDMFEMENDLAINVKGEPKLITVGNVTERKGQLNVINHLPELIKKHPNIHYHCVGIPTMMSEFMNVAKQLNVDSHVTFHGHLSQRELQQYLNSSDIFVMLSGATKEGDVEGFGIAVLEANYLKIPAIGSLNCGIEDAIDNYKSGILIDHLNTAQFIKAIDAIMANKQEYSKASKSWALQHSWEIIIQRYIKNMTT